MGLAGGLATNGQISGSGASASASDAGLEPYRFDVSTIRPARNASAPLAILDYASGVNIYETSVEYMPDGWGSDTNSKAWRYWMVFGDNPQVRVSDDGITWQLPPGLSDPVFAIPNAGAGNGNYCDPQIYLSPDKTTLYLIWNWQTNANSVGSNGVWYSTSTNGVTWAAPIQLIVNATTAGTNWLSPRLLYVEGLWHLWHLDAQLAQAVVRHRSATTLGGLASATDTACTGLFPTFLSSTIWEFEIKRVEGEWWMLLSDHGGSVGNKLTFATSVDAITWTQSGTILAPSVSGWDNGTNTGLYKSAFVATRDGAGVKIKLWYCSWGAGVGYTTTYAGRAPYERVSVGSSGATPVLLQPAAAGSTETLTLTANAAPVFPPSTPGITFKLALTQDATGSRTVTWPGNVYWPAGTAPTLTTTAGATDLLEFTSIDGGNWLGRALAQNFSSSAIIGSSGAFAPSSIASLQLWLDASNITSPPADGAVLTTWNDLSGNARNLGQATTGNKPIYHTALSAAFSVNGRPAVWFDGSTKFMTLAGVPIAAATPCTIFAVAQSLDLSAKKALLQIGTANGLGFQFFGGSSYDFLYRGVADHNVPGGDSRSHIWQGDISGGTGTFRLDGTVGGTNADTATAPTGTTYLGQTDVADGRWNGPICEILVWSVQLTAAQIQQVNGYLRAKWGTP